MFDCIIIGGGVGGLALATQLAALQWQVLLIEKEEYPFHKVCGEYLSNESVRFLKRLGCTLDEYKPPAMDKLLLTSVSGIAINRKLDIGGVGISRYVLDKQLADIAVKTNVTVLTGTKVERVEFLNDKFKVHTAETVYETKVACGCYGRRSNLDVQAGRQYRAAKKDMYVGVKYHIRADYDPHRVELHNFKDGYCGMSGIEDGKVNFSYISKATNLRECGNDIRQMEERILSRNPYLSNYIHNAEFLFKPVVVSHVDFDVRSALAGHMLMTGDAAGSIAPLSGNGMSMALRASKLAAGRIHSFLNGDTTRQQMEQLYNDEWNTLFRRRIKRAKIVHSLFGKPFLNNASFMLFKLFPFIVDGMSRQIHGEEF